MDQSRSARETDETGRPDNVVIAHGLWMPGHETVFLRRWLKRRGFAPQVFRYRSVRDSLDRNAERLDELVRGLAPGTVHLLGYSLGGIVIARMLSRGIARHGLAPTGPHIGSVVCLGTPFRDSAAVRSLWRLPGGRHVLGKSITEYVFSGGLQAWEFDAPLGVIAGDVGIGLGRLLMAHSQPNDGTVAVAETRIEGMSDHIVLRVSHSTMLYSTAVVDNAAHFFRHGTFSHPSR